MNDKPVTTLNYNPHDPGRPKMTEVKGMEVIVPTDTSFDLGVKAEKSVSVDKTLTERGSTYGPFSANAEVSQRLKSAMYYKGGPSLGWLKLTWSQKEALEMIALKISRIVTGDPNHADSWHDIAGYATLIEKQLKGEDI